MGPGVITLMSYNALDELFGKFNDSIEDHLTNEMIQIVLEELIEKEATWLLTQGLIDKIQNVDLLLASMEQYCDSDFENMISRETAIRIMHSMKERERDFPCDLVEMSVRNVTACMSPEAFNALLEGLEECGLTKFMISEIKWADKKRKKEADEERNRVVLAKDCS